MSPTTMIVLNVLLDLAVVAGLAAVLLRPFVLERERGTRSLRSRSRQELRRAA